MSDYIAPSELYSRIEVLLKPIAQYWLITLFTHDCYNSVAPLNALNYAAHKYFKHLDPQPKYWAFYDPHDPQRPEISMPVVLDTKDVLCKAIVTYNTCTDACFVLYDLISKLLEDRFQGSNLEWCRSTIRPRIVLFSATAIKEGAEILNDHEFLRVTIPSGEVFVIDPSAWQFGFRTWFYTWDEYVKECLDLDPKFPLQVLDAESEIKGYWENTDKSEYDQMMCDLKRDLGMLKGETLREWIEGVQNVEF